MAVRPAYSISICTGLAGLELGVELAAPGFFTPAMFCEREAYVANRLAELMQAGAISNAPIWGNVKTLCSRRVRDYVRARTGGAGIGLFTGGYPCQPFSTAGRRAGRKDPRHLWPWIADAVAEYRPDLCFFENVSGHLSLGFREVGEDLESMGYTVAAGLFTASEVGPPHKRERLFILAVADSQGVDRGSRSAGIRGASGRRAVGGSGGIALADAAGLDDGERQRQRIGTEAGDGAESRVEGCGGPLVHAGSDGRRIGQPERGSDRRTVAGGAGRPAFPPGPGDADAWRFILDRWPHLAPATEAPPKSAVRRMDDGMAGPVVYRVDSLRACGNGVVPISAAGALIQLLAAVVNVDAL